MNISREGWPENPKWSILGLLVEKIRSNGEKVLVYDPSARLILALVEMFQERYDKEKVVYFVGKTPDYAR